MNNLIEGGLYGDLFGENPKHGVKKKNASTNASRKVPKKEE